MLDACLLPLPLIPFQEGDVGDVMLPKLPLELLIKERWGSALSLSLCVCVGGGLLPDGR